MQGPTSLRLRVPDTEQIRHLLLDTDPRSLTSHIQDLPYADIPGALEQALAKLHTLNRFHLPSGKRFQCTLAFHYAFRQFFGYFQAQALQTRITAKSHQDLDRFLGFLQELGYACKHIIQATVANKKTTSGFANVLYMAMCYQYFHALYSCNRGRMLSKAHWQEMHSLYFLACERQLTQNAVAMPQEKVSTIEILYKKSLLLGIASPYNLSTQEQWWCASYLDRYASQCQLVASSDPELFEEGYSVDADCDAPAYIPGSSTLASIEGRVLDNSALLETLQRHIAGLHRGDTLRNLGLPGKVNRNEFVRLLSMLFHTWSRTPTRAHERLQCDESIGLVWGLDTICNMLDPERRRFSSLMGEDAASERNRNDRRAWSTACDQSRNGFCVRLNPESDHYPDAGQIIALIRQNQERKFLELGMVKWSAINEENIPRCGIQRLHGNTRKIIIQSTEEMKPEQNGLLLSSRSTGSTYDRLIAPCGRFKSSDNARIQNAGDLHYSEAMIGNMHMQSRSVDIFEVQIPAI